MEISKPPIPRVTSPQGEGEYTTYNLGTQNTAQTVTPEDRKKFLEALAEQKQNIANIKDEQQKQIAIELFKLPIPQRDAAIEKLKASNQITLETEMMFRIEDFKEVDRSNDLITKLADIAKKTASTAYEKQKAGSKFNKGGSGLTQSDTLKKSNLSEKAQESLNALQKIKEQGQNHITDEDLRNLNITPQVGAELQEYLLAKKENSISSLANLPEIPENVRMEIQTLFEKSPPDYPAIMTVLQENGISTAPSTTTPSQSQSPSSSDIQKHLAPQTVQPSTPSAIAGLAGGNIQYNIPAA